MVSSAYYTWVSKGKPYALTKPARELQALLRGYGYTVYDYPNDEHQTAEPPEDHTPYSATEWPVQIDAYIAHALDVMPPGSAAVAKGAISLPDLARNIIADRDAHKPGTMWIKYMNWSDENGVCRQESWKTTPRTTVSSTDRGHIHLSGRTDTEAYSIGDWNPVMTLAGIDMTNRDANAQAYRIEALAHGLDVFGGTSPIKGSPVAAWGRIAAEVAKVLKPQLDEIEAQVKANGDALSQIKAALATDAGSGGLSETEIRQLVSDEVAKLIKATRLALG